MEMLIGTLWTPFKFGKESPHQPEPAPQTTGETTTNKKGGAKCNKGEVVVPRRPPVKDYFPPGEFDIHRVGSALRDEGAIRKLIPKEVTCKLAPLTLPHTTLACPLPFSPGCHTHPKMEVIEVDR